MYGKLVLEMYKTLLLPLPVRHCQLWGALLGLGCAHISSACSGLPSTVILLEDRDTILKHMIQYNMYIDSWSNTGWLSRLCPPQPRMDQSADYIGSVRWRYFLKMIRHESWYITKKVRQIFSALSYTRWHFGRKKQVLLSFALSNCQVLPGSNAMYKTHVFSFSRVL